MFSHLHPSYWSLSEWSFLTDRSGSSWRSLEFWPGRPHLSCSACTEERTCVNCGWPQGRSVQTDDLREGLMIQTTLVGLNFHRTTEKNRVLLPVLQGRGKSGFNSRAGTKPNRASLERMSLTAADLIRRIEMTTFATTSQLHRRAGRRSSQLVECSSPNRRPLLPSGASLRRCL